MVNAFAFLKTFSLYMCATCSELPSYNSTMDACFTVRSSSMIQYKLMFQYNFMIFKVHYLDQVFYLKIYQRILSFYYPCKKN